MWKGIRISRLLNSSKTEFTFWIRNKITFSEIPFYRKCAFNAFECSPLILEHFCYECCICSTLYDMSTEASMKVLYYAPPHVLNAPGILPISSSCHIPLHILHPPTTLLSACSGPADGLPHPGICCFLPFTGIHISPFFCFIFSLEETPHLVISWEKLHGQ